MLPSVMGNAGLSPTKLSRCDQLCYVFFSHGVVGKGSVAFGEGSLVKWQESGPHPASIMDPPGDRSEYERIRAHVCVCVCVFVRIGEWCPFMIYVDLREHLEST